MLPMMFVERSPVGLRRYEMEMWLLQDPGATKEEQTPFCRFWPGNWVSSSHRLCQLSRLLIDDVSAILPRAQAVSRMPSAIEAVDNGIFRIICQCLHDWRSLLPI